MTNEELNTALYEKLFAEQQDFKGWLVKQPPEEILKHAYEYVIREDIVIEMEYHDLTDDEAKALLADEKPLQAIFSVYENTEGGHMDEIRDCIESRAKTCMENQCEALRNLPVYIFSATFAKGHGELEEYRASFKANVACRDAIEDAIASHYADNRLDGSCVQEVVDRFGAERVSFVLANRKIRSGQKPSRSRTTSMPGTTKRLWSIPVTKLTPVLSICSSIGSERNRSLKKKRSRLC